MNAVFYQQHQVSSFHVTCHIFRVTTWSLSSCTTEFWQSRFPQQQEPRRRAGDPEEAEAANHRRPLVDVRLQPGGQAAVRRWIHVRPALTFLFSQSAALLVQREHVACASFCAQVRPLRGVRWFPDAPAGAVWPVAVSQPGGLFHLSPHRENHLHRFHGHCLFYLHGPQHGRSCISCCESCH